MQYSLQNWADDATMSVVALQAWAAAVGSSAAHRDAAATAASRGRRCSLEGAIMPCQPASNHVCYRVKKATGNGDAGL
jgi:hypothetical protein